MSNRSGILGNLLWFSNLASYLGFRAGKSGLRPPRNNLCSEGRFACKSTMKQSTENFNRQFRYWFPSSECRFGL